MDQQSKLRLLEQQIDAANDGNPENFQVWRQQTEVVLRNVVGDVSPLYKSFESVRYSLSAVSTGTPESAHVAARVRGVQQATAILEAAKLEVELAGGVPSAADSAKAAGGEVFIVHGHGDAAKHEVARFVRALTGNEPVILHEQPNEGRTIIEKFEDYASAIGYAIVLGTADDLGAAKDQAPDELHPRSRQNVVFELGFFFGALGRSRVALLYDESIERPSDTDGIVRVPLDDVGGWKLTLARELEAAGIGVDWSALRH